MDTVLDWTVVVLPTFLAIAAMWIEPWKKHPRTWRVLLLLFGISITILTIWQQQRQRDASNKRAAKIEAMLKTAEERQQLAQQKLTESLQREQRLNDQNNDLQTDLRAQDELLQIMKQSLPSKLRKKADSIHKQYAREVYDSSNEKDSVTAETPKVSTEEQQSYIVISALIGVVSSLIATCISAAIVLFRARHVRNDRANPFVGKYEMLDPTTKKPRGGTVAVGHEQRSWWDADTTAKLKAFAKNASDQKEWDGTLEVRGLSDIASGFYLYQNNTGGFLQFTRVGESEGKSDIMEQGHPHNPHFEKFERLLRRLT